MLGRGILQNPMLAAELRGVNFERELLKTFFFKLEDYYLKLFLEADKMEEDCSFTEKQSKIAKALSDKMKELCKYMFREQFDAIAADVDLEELNTIVSRMFR